MTWRASIASLNKTGVTTEGIWRSRPAGRRRGRQRTFYFKTELHCFSAIQRKIYGGFVHSQKLKSTFRSINYQYLVWCKISLNWSLNVFQKLFAIQTFLTYAQNRFTSSRTLWCPGQRDRENLYQRRVTNQRQN